MKKFIVYVILTIVLFFILAFIGFNLTLLLTNTTNDSDYFTIVLIGSILIVLNIYHIIESSKK